MHAQTILTGKVPLKQGNNTAAVHKLGWPCDSRPLALLVQQDGFQPRARQDKVKSDWNLDKPWHPYSLDVYRDAIYLRKGQNRDNCLHTAVSIGTDVKQLVHFPILTDASNYTLP